MESHNEQDRAQRMCRICNQRPSAKWRTICLLCKNKQTPLEKRRAYKNAWMRRKYGESKELYANQRLRKKYEVIKAYGSICKCCGESNPFFLTIDHTNNDGTIQRTSIPAQRKIWSYLYGKEVDHATYQLLCFNCNGGRATTKDKICPHVLAELKQNLDYMKTAIDFVADNILRKTDLSDDAGPIL
jgi:hypothetical protein